MTASVVVEMVYQTTANRKKKKKEKRSKQKKEKEITPMRSAIQKASLKAETQCKGENKYNLTFPSLTVVISPGFCYRSMGEILLLPSFLERKLRVISIESDRNGSEVRFFLIIFFIRDSTLQDLIMAALESLATAKYELTAIYCGRTKKPMKQKQSTKRT